MGSTTSISPPTVSDFLMDTYKDWVNMGFDGIRVDAARSVPKDWLEDFELEMGVPTFGEVFVGDIDTCRSTRTTSGACSTSRSLERPWHLRC